MTASTNNTNQTIVFGGSSLTHFGLTPLTDVVVNYDESPSFYRG